MLDDLLTRYKNLADQSISRFTDSNKQIDSIMNSLLEDSWDSLIDLKRILEVDYDSGLGFAQGFVWLKPTAPTVASPTKNSKNSDTAVTKKSLFNPTTATIRKASIDNVSSYVIRFAFMHDIDGLDKNASVEVCLNTSEDAIRIKLNLDKMLNKIRPDDLSNYKLDMLKEFQNIFPGFLEDIETKIEDFIDINSKRIGM